MSVWDPRTYLNLGGVEEDSKQTTIFNRWIVYCQEDVTSDTQAIQRAHVSLVDVVIAVYEVFDHNSLVLCELLDLGDEQLI